MGVPWLEQPMSLAWHPPNECSLNDTAQCAYQMGYWRNWNVADYHYALPTVALFMVGIVLFALANVVEEFLPKAASRSAFARRVRGAGRYLSYRNFRIDFLNWNSAPLGLLLLATVGLIYFLCMTLVPQPYYWPNTAEVDYGDQPPIAIRSGWLSIACLPFVFATAGKSNLITGITGISHEKLQIFHRWISYAFFVTALVHTFPFIIYHISIGDMVEQWNTEIYYWTGVIAIIAQAWLTFASFGPLRTWCYEWFKFSHFAAALIFMIFLFFHCDGEFSAWDYFVATGILFSVSWLHRQIKIYFEHGFGHKAELRLESSGFIRASVPTSATWRVGQHFFVRFLTPDLHALTTHPFTACSLPEAADVHDSTTNELVFYIRPREGMTARLARSLETSGQRSLRVLLDGPYGGVDMRKLEASDRTVIIAGGSGAGWTLPIVAAHLRKLEYLSVSDHKKVLPSLRVVLATREPGTRTWYEGAVRDLIADHDLEKVTGVMDVDIFYTGTEQSIERPKLSQRSSEKMSDTVSSTQALEKDVISAVNSSSSVSSRGTDVLQVRHHTSRPDLPAILNGEAAALDSTTQLGIYVCGPLSMQADVANAVAQQQLSTMKDGLKDIYLHMEHFSWA